MDFKKIWTLFLAFNFFTFIGSLKLQDSINGIRNKGKKSKIFFEPNLLINNDDDLVDISEKYESIRPKPDNPDYFYIPIFSSSDIHGHFYPEIIEVGNLSYTKGGLDYLGKYINIIRNEFNNRFLYLDAGDIFQGGTESTITNGQIILDYFNLINLNGSTIGNHEYDEDRTFIEQKVRDAKFPFITTNVFDTKKNTKKAFGDNHITSEVYTLTVPNVSDKVKIGVIGLSIKMEQQQIAGKGFEDIIFLNYKDELISESNKLRNEDKVNAVILLSHLAIGCGNENNLTLNMFKPTDKQESCETESDIYTLINSIDEGGVDAVVTGHSHKEVHNWVNGIPIISPVNNGFYANIMYLAFDRKNNYKLVKDQTRIEGPLPICDKIFKKDHKCELINKDEINEYLPLMNYKFHGVKIEKESILQPIHDKYDDMYKNYSEIICTVIGTDEILTIEKNGSFYLGNMIADIYRHVTGAEISIVSYGNLRSSWSPGKIPRYKINDLQPFRNIFCTFVMNGEEVKKMLKIIQRGRKKYYVTSGIKQVLAKDKNGEYYLTDVKLFDGYKEYDIKSSDEYLISANDFISKGGDDFDKVLPWYKPRNLNCNYGVDAEIVEKYLKAQQVIDVRKYIDNDNPRIRFID